MATGSGHLECDRYGVPQYAGQPELFEEYQERCWDLFHGREGQEHLQVATPLHLRANLSGSAYEAVRKLEHTALRTKDSEGKVIDRGLKLFLQTLKENIAVEQPVRLNELFLRCFYSPQVWRRSSETMAQYIVRREQDFARLKEASSETQVSENVRCLLLLQFSGLDVREQQAVLASVGNEYDLKKISHALRIQYPNTIPRPVLRKDFLGTGRTTATSVHSKLRFKGSQKIKQVLASEDIDENDPAFDDEEAFAEGDFDEAEDAEESDGVFVTYSEDESLDALLQEIPWENPDDSHLAEAYATVAQHRMQKRSQGSPKKTSPKPPSMTMPFKAHGDLSFEQKSKEQRARATTFLKSVTQCTACLQRGHWVGDPECPKASKKGKGKGTGKKKSGGSSPKKKSQPATTYFVLHDESPDLPDHAAQTYFIEPNDATDFDDGKIACPAAAANTAAGEFTLCFTDSLDDDENVQQPSEKIHSVLMVLKDTDLCEHSSYRGGEEKNYHRGANGHTRHVTCQDPACAKTVIMARRRESIAMWKYLVQIALCTKWGKAARSRELAATIARLTVASSDAEHLTLRTCTRDGVGLMPVTPASAGYATPSDWSIVGTESPYTTTTRRLSPHVPVPPQVGHLRGDGPAPKANIVYADVHPDRAWLYGVLLCLEEELPPFPELGDSDMAVLQPLPCDDTLVGHGDLAGRSFLEVASLPEHEWFCRATMQHALANCPMRPEVFRFAFYLYGRLKLVRSAAVRMMKGDPHSVLKRTADPHQMEAQRCIQVPLQPFEHDAHRLEPHFCDVMMTTEIEKEEAKTGEPGASSEGPLLEETTYVLQEEESPGLAILDSGCTRTMHGSRWAARFEEKLKEIGLKPKKMKRTQLFRGVGGETKSDCVKAFPIRLGGVPGEIYSAETEGGLPLLISRPFMEKLGTVLDLKRNVVSFEAIGVSGLPLLKTSKGHLAVDLLDHGEVKSPEPLNNKSTEFKDCETESQSNSTPHSSGYPDHCHAPPSDACDSDDPGAPFDYEAQDTLEFLRADVEGYHDFMKTLEDERKRDYPDEGLLCEEQSIFEKLVKEDAFTVRKTTARKGKKIDTMCRILDSDDWDKKRILQDINPRAITRKPPVGKTWVKQIFAGQMGLTLLAVIMGMQVGTPLDSSSTSWDASTSAGLRWMNRDMQVEDPYLLVITHPCGPWGNWSRFNLHRGGPAAETVLAKREENRPVLKTVNKSIKDRVKANRRVFVEQPWGSASLDEPEMSDVRALLQSGKLIQIKVDGCMLGYADSESGLPHKKPSYYLTTMLAAENIFSNCLCSGDHQHEPLEGANKHGSRTAQAAEWPQRLNKLVLEAMVQQASIEASATTEIQETFPSEVRALQGQQQGRRKRARRQGRVLSLSGPHQAPPVYLRPEVPDQPLPLEDQQPDQQPDHEDDASFRASRASALEPILSMDEGTRRHEWLQIQPELRKVIRDLHVNLGHPTSSTHAENPEATECQAWSHQSRGINELWCLWRILTKAKT